MNDAVLGVRGENLAVKFLKKKGYKLISKNYRNSIGEIDIICYYPKNEEYVFVEVKTRSSASFGLPSEAVNLKKQNKIKQTATFFLKQNKLLDCKIRFDVIEVLENKINQIEYAF